MSISTNYDFRKFDFYKYADYSSKSLIDKYPPNKYYTYLMNKCLIIGYLGFEQTTTAFGIITQEFKVRIAYVDDLPDGYMSGINDLFPLHRNTKFIRAEYYDTSKSYENINIEHLNPYYDKYDN